MPDPRPVGDVPQMSPRDLKARLDRGERMVLLDVREPAERDHCVIAAPAGTVVDLFLPMGEVASRHHEIPADRGPVIVYCHHGVRSMAVARWLAHQGGGDVRNLDGGIDAWSLGVDPGVPRY